MVSALSVVSSPLYSVSPAYATSTTLSAPVVVAPAFAASTAMTLSVDTVKSPTGSAPDCTVVAAKLNGCDAVLSAEPV